MGIPSATSSDIAYCVHELLGRRFEPRVQLGEGAALDVRRLAPSDRRCPHLLREDEALEHVANARSFLREVVTHSWQDVEGLVQLLLRQRGRRIEQLTREPEVMFDESIGQVHRHAPFVAGGKKQPARRVEVDAVRRAQSEIARIPAGRGAEGAGKRTRERLRGPVACVEPGLGDRGSSPEFPRSAFEQQPAPERSRRLAERGRDQPLVVETAQVRARGELGTRDRVVEACQDDVDERSEAVTSERGGHGEMISLRVRLRLIAVALRDRQRSRFSRGADGYEAKVLAGGLERKVEHGHKGS
jgi:hypothetical protein